PDPSTQLVERPTGGLEGVACRASLAEPPADLAQGEERAGALERDVRLFVEIEGRFKQVPRLGELAGRREEQRGGPLHVGPVAHAGLAREAGLPRRPGVTRPG